ncbi:hypothetical protein Tco_1106834 [Tanacetum coccineum]
MESLGQSIPDDRCFAIKQLTVHMCSITLIEDIYLLMTIDVMIVNIFNLLCGLGRWAIPLDKGLFEEIKVRVSTSTPAIVHADIEFRKEEK